MSAGGIAARAHRSVVRESPGAGVGDLPAPTRVKRAEVGTFWFFSPVAQQWRGTYANWNVLRGGLVNVLSANEPARGPAPLAPARW